MSKRKIVSFLLLLLLTVSVFIANIIICLLYTSFDSDDFRKSVTSLKELYSSNERNEDNILPMLSSNGQIELFALYDEIADIENDNDEPIILNTPNKDCLLYTSSLPKQRIISLSAIRRTRYLQAISMI